MRLQQVQYGVLDAFQVDIRPQDQPHAQSVRLDMQTKIAIQVRGAQYAARGNSQKQRRFYAYDAQLIRNAHFPSANQKPAYKQPQNRVS